MSVNWKPWHASNAALFQNIPQDLELRRDVSVVPKHKAMGKSLDSFVEGGRVVAETVAPRDSFFFWHLQKTQHVDLTGDGVADAWVTKDAFEKDKTISVTMGGAPDSDRPRTVYSGPGTVAQVDIIGAGKERETFRENEYRQTFADGVRETRHDFARDGIDGKTDLAIMGRSPNDNARDGWPYIGYSPDSDK